MPPRRPRASVQAAAPVDARDTAAVRPNDATSWRTRRRSTRMPPNRRRLAVTSSSTTASASSTTLGVNWSNAYATPRSSSSSRAVLRRQIRALAASVSTPPRRMPSVTPSSRAARSSATTRSCSSTTRPSTSFDDGSGDRGRNDSRVRRGRCTPIQTSMAVQQNRGGGQRHEQRFVALRAAALHEGHVDAVALRR